MSSSDEKDFDNEIAGEENYITLTDDNGEDIHFEVLDTFDFNGRNFIVLIPFEDVDDEVVILEITSSEDSENDEYISIEDENLLSDVFEEFKKRNADNFDFAD